MHLQFITTYKFLGSIWLPAQWELSARALQGVGSDPRRSSIRRRVAKAATEAWANIHQNHKVAHVMHVKSVAINVPHFFHIDITWYYVVVYKNHWKSICGAPACSCHAEISLVFGQSVKHTTHAILCMQHHGANHWGKWREEGKRCKSMGVLSRWEFQGFSLVYCDSEHSDDCW